MSLLCSLFGHVPEYGYGNYPGGGYFDIIRGAIDGVGRLHCELRTTCERCGKKYTVGYIHIFDKPYPNKPGDIGISWQVVKE